jgi:hypothetical protein
MQEARSQQVKKKMNGKMCLFFILRLKAFGLSLLRAVLHLEIPDTILLRRHF